VHTPDTAGGHERDSGHPAGRERPADSCRAKSALDDASRDVPRADLASLLARFGEPLERRTVKPDTNRAVEYPDCRSNGARRPDAIL
jgi:hypothetical protein